MSSATTLSPQLLPMCNLFDEGEWFFLPPDSYGKWKTAEYSGFAATTTGAFLGLIILFFLIDQTTRIPRNYGIALCLLIVFVATLVNMFLIKKKLKKEKKSCVDATGKLFMH